MWTVVHGTEVSEADTQRVGQATNVRPYALLIEGPPQGPQPKDARDSRRGAPPPTGVQRVRNARAVRSPPGDPRSRQSAGYKSKCPQTPPIGPWTFNAVGAVDDASVWAPVPLAKFPAAGPPCVGTALRRPHTPQWSGSPSPRRGAWDRPALVPPPAGLGGREERRRPSAGVLPIRLGSGWPVSNTSRVASAKGESCGPTTVGASQQSRV